MSGLRWFMSLVKRPFLSLNRGAFRLGDEIIFKDTSWTFSEDEQWAVVGPNGSGKSLFAAALCGNLPVVGGDLNYHFEPLAGVAAEECIGCVSFERRKENIGETVVQSRWNSIEDEGALNVREWLSYERVMKVNPYEVTTLHQKARPLFEQRFKRAVSLLHVERFLSRPILSLSNGEMQQIQLTRALCQPLRLLILDEPFAGLDEDRREFLHGVLDELMKNMRVMVITTRVEDLPHKTTHLLCVDKCRVIAAGLRNEILSLRHVKKILASTPRTKTKLLSIPVGQKTSPRKGSGIELANLQNVTVRYGDEVILDHVDWTIREGESWALLGPNGSGKTTLLSLILGDNPQVYGNDVTVFGKRRGRGESIWDVKRKIGWFSPELLLHFDDSSSCFDVVASGFRDTIGLFEPPTRSQRHATREILERYGLLDQADVPLYGISGGMQRLVLLLRALVKKPRLLILDEPCQGLDREHRERFVKVVDGLVRSREVTVIFVTHRADEIPHSIKRTMRLGARQP